MKQVIQLPEPLTADELMAQIHANSLLDYEFHQLRNDFQTFFIDICTGKKNLPFTLDPFFKHIFDVDVYPERLASFLSAILNQPVTVEQILPNQHGQLVEGGSFVIMDIIVRLADGSIVNVEIQRNPYQFQGERLSCYSADLVMRQYQQIHSKTNSGYKDMKPVYSIVLYETSSANFKKFPDQYIHRGGWRFDTDLQLNMLQQFICIPLDIFKKITDNKSTITNELEAWLTFLSSTNPHRIQAVIQKYPEFIKVYQSAFTLRRDIKEVFSMFSDALRILDRNEEARYYSELETKIPALEAQVKEKEAQLQQQKNQLQQQDEQLQQQDKQLQQQDKQLQQQYHELQETHSQLLEKSTQLQETNAQLLEKDSQLQEKNARLQEKDKEIAQLKAMLKNR